MKLTKGQLKKIIQEETAKALQEARYQSMPRSTYRTGEPDPDPPPDPSIRDWRRDPLEKWEIGPAWTSDRRPRDWTAADEERLNRQKGSERWHRGEMEKRKEQDRAHWGKERQKRIGREEVKQAAWPENVKDPQWRSMYGVPKHFTDEEAIENLHRFGERMEKAYKLRKPSELDIRNFPHLGDGRYDKYFPPKRSWAKKLFGIREAAGAPGQDPAKPRPSKGDDPQARARIGQKQVTRQQLASAEYEKSKRIRGGETLGQGVTPIENSILLDVEKVLTAIAENDDLNKYRSILQNVVNILRKKAGV